MVAVATGRIQATSAGLSMAVFGAVVGIAQGLVLRRTIGAGWWVLASCIGWGASGVLIGFNAGGSTSTIGPDAGPVDPLLSTLVVPPLVVLLFGSGQWLILRRGFLGAGWWLLVNAGGLVAGFGLGLIVAKALPWLASSQFPSARVGGVAGAVAGLVYGAIAWAFLAGLRRRTSPSVAAAPRSRQP
jgi:hypothetical protein